MKKQCKRILSDILAALLAVQFVVGSVGAANLLSAETESEQQTQMASYSYINPMYRDVVRDQDIPAMEQASSDALETQETSYYTSYADAGAYVRKQMKSRKTSFTLRYKAKSSVSFNTLADKIFEQAIKHTGVGTEGDYLAAQYDRYNCGTSYTVSNGYSYHTMKYNVKYFTTSDQESKVTSAVNSLRSSLGLSGKSDYQKILTVHDWMCRNIKYVDGGMDVYHSAYGAIINRKCVCQGFAVLFYRLMLDEGIDCRYVDSYRLNHGWNIVKLENKYYHIDVTWDENNYEDTGKLSNTYFLKGTSDFKDHNNSDDNLHRDASFKASYPMSSKAYDPTTATHTHTWKSTVTKAATNTTVGIQTYTCSSCQAAYTEIIPKLEYGDNNGNNGNNDDNADDSNNSGAVSKEEQNIKANDITLSASTQAQTTNIAVELKGDTSIAFYSSSPYITVTSAGKVTVKANYAGTATISIVAAETDDYSESLKTVTVTVNKIAQPMAVSPTSKTYKYATVKSKAQTFTIKPSKAQGKVTYQSSNTKYVTVSSAGKVTVNKGAKKGTYTITVTAAGKGIYNKGSKTVKVTVK